MILGMADGSASLHAAICAQATRTPSVRALTDGHAVLDYANLLDVAHRQAAALRARGMQPGDVVAVLAVRSVDTLALMLAIALGGGACLPLDAAYPPERLATMLEDARPRLLLAPTTADLPAMLGMQRCDPRELADAPAPGTSTPAPGPLAYVLFTSGSSGRPKGVAMRSDVLARLVAWHVAHPRLGQVARTLQFAPLSFDVAFQEMFSTWATGGCLWLPDEAERRDPQALLALLARERIERLFLPYVALQALAEAFATGGVRPGALRDVITAGEALRITPAIRALFAALPGCVLHNHYGPTETHVVTTHELDGNPADWPELPPIGRPLPHVRVRLVDAALADVEAGAEGELLLGGDCLAEGYIHRPELTAERFIEAAGERWYRSGDAARDLGGGVLACLGRLDDQLKLDGYRVEPGEIEAVLCRHPGVAEAVVVAVDGQRLLAHVVPRDAQTDDVVLVAQLKEACRASLPTYLMPHGFVLLPALPLTASGKIDRRQLAREAARPALDWPLDAPLEQQWLGLWRQLLGVETLSLHDNLFEAGARSLTVVRALAELRRHGHRRLGVAQVYASPTVAGQLAWLAAAAAGVCPHEVAVRRAGPRLAAAAGIAIVGMAGRFPGAADVASLWANLMAGHESLARFSAAELSASVPAAWRANPHYVPVRGVIDGARRFDAAFFGITPAQARLIDPQQRVFLELCWNALEHAGIDPARAPGSIGVYAGTANNTYRKQVDAHPDLVQASGEFATMLANEKDYVATRVAHKLDLRGPAVSIHTACSTSLVAVAQAWHALASGQCDVALAGGISIAVPEAAGYLPVEGGMESADGHCRPFDAAANGTVFSSGGAVVVLKRVDDAIAAGDTIYAVIRGVGLNNDGADKASFGAPSVRGQAEVIAQALASAGVSADTMGYVEAHGTATPLGDPIEVAALERAFRAETDARQFCWLGSVKGNLGHLNAASGVVGLIKAALALHHGRIPATLHYHAPNPEIDFAGSPFKVADHAIDWPRSDVPRRAGVSSFGVGGTNAHVVLEEAPLPTVSSAPVHAYTLLPVSARNEDALRRRGDALAEALQTADGAQLADAGGTLALGRSRMAVRGFVVAETGMAAAEALRQLAPHAQPAEPLRVVMLFPGQGSQHIGMARELVASEAVFRTAFEHCCALASGYLGRDLAALILPEAGNAQAAAALLMQTCHAQPALFAIEYALAELWSAWGIEPAAMIGHSIGEYVAACRAGVFSLADALALVVARGAAMQQQPQGAMLAVRADADALVAHLPPAVEMAACNAPGLTVLAGPEAAITACAQALQAEGIAATRLAVSHAFHSASMSGAQPLLRAALDKVSLQAPRQVFYSCVSGAPITADEATSVDYWCRQLRAPVRFADAVAHAAALAPSLLLEVGPAQALAGLARRVVGKTGHVVASMGAASAPGDAAAQVLRALGELWCAGIEPDWQKYFAGQTRRRVPLPVYPFAGEEHWIEPPAMTPAPAMGWDMPISVSSVPTAPARAERLAGELRELFESLSGEHLQAADDHTGFLQLGLDSLALTQATLEIERRHGVKLKFRRLMEDLDHVAALAALLDAQLPADIAPLVAPPAASASAPDGNANPALAQLLHQQMAFMQQQSELLRALAGQASVPAAMPVAASVAAAPTDEVPADLRARPFGASARIASGHQVRLTAAQQAWVAGFTANYARRTAKSKAFSQSRRALMADPRVVTGFDPRWKELTYPIVVDRSSGARLWDIDGNEYIDALNGFGVNFLGYQPPFVVAAMHAQVDAGIEIGPQHPLAAEVSRLISEITGMPRVALCNTGSEAVMGAMRIARTVSGRKTIAIFRDSYHGIFDEVIVRGTRTLRSIAAAPGILASAVENVLVLDYGSDEALRIIDERKHELAAVLIEPVQSRNPTLQPREFVHALRGLCDAGGCALIFDEVITGLRMAPGGAQEFYGVRADIATYGKIIGGGLPLAAIAGDAHWLDALDGGPWQFGDDSQPEAGVTYFAGTFVRHPLALAAAHAALGWIKAQGPELQRGLNQRNTDLIAQLNAVFAARNAPLVALGHSSLWRIRVDDDQPCASLFWYRLRHAGVHVYEQFNCFLSLAHGEAEVACIVAAVTASVDELLAHGVLAPRDGVVMPMALPAAVPLSEGQMEKWLACQYGETACVAFNESSLLHFTGALDEAAFVRALQRVWDRHEALRLSFDADGKHQRVHAEVPLPLVQRDYRVHGSEAEARFVADAEARMATPFELTKAPLVRLALVRLGDEAYGFQLLGHHLVLDGWSLAVILDELATCYNAERAGYAPVLPPAASFRAHVLAEHARQSTDTAGARLAYWKDLYAEPVQPLTLPGDRPAPARADFSASTECCEFDEALTEALRMRARQTGISLYGLLLAGFGAWLAMLTGADDFAVAMPYAGQAESGAGALVGDGVNTLPLRLRVKHDATPATLLQSTHAALLDATEHHDATLMGILAALNLRRRGSAAPLASVVFNLNPAVPVLALDGTTTRIRDCRRVALMWELFFNLNETGRTLSLDLHYSTARFEATTIRRWMAQYEGVLRALAAGQADTVTTLLHDCETSMTTHPHHPTAKTMPATTFTDPREEQLAAVWCELIGVTDVRAEDNFFDLGGHSLLAVEMVARVQRDTGVRFNLMNVATDTLAMLAMELPKGEVQRKGLGQRMRGWFATR